MGITGNMLKEKMNSLIMEIEQENPHECSLKEDGNCVFNLAGEWNMILMSKELSEFQKLKSLVLSLAAKVREFKGDDILLMYDEPEWKELCSHRGPVEGVAECTCKKCQRISYSFATSGFMNIVFFVNESEKKVIIEDPFENFDPPEGYYRPSASCPFCHGELKKEWISPYTVFQKYKIIKSNY
ncbi:MAG: hypothetical protein PQJ50_15145 [Spirochaetales bacterium]|nr:hypothetical protein [Spirochaetales bacterium]